MTGFLAWLAWGLIHILYLVSFRSRFTVGVQWFFWYITGKRAVRLIKPPIYEERTGETEPEYGIPASFLAHEHAGLEDCPQCENPKHRKEEQIAEKASPRVEWSIWKDG